MIEITQALTLVASSGLVVVIVGVVEAIKRALNLDSRFAPLLAIALGIGALGSLDGFSTVAIFEGIVAGLAASGLYSGVKTTAGL